MQVNLRARVKRGDGVAFDAGMPEEQEEGGLVYEVKGGGFMISGGACRVYGEWCRVRLHCVGCSV